MVWDKGLRLGLGAARGSDGSCKYGRLSREGRSSHSAGVSLADGILHQVGRSVYVELLHYVGPVILHGADTDEQKAGDLVAGLALSNQLEDLSFPHGQIFLRGLGSAATDFYEIRGQLLGEDG